MDPKAEKLLKMIVHGFKYAVGAAGRYVAANGRMILGLFAILLAAWGIDIQSVPGWALTGKLMASTGVALKAWLSNSESKPSSPQAQEAGGAK